MSTLGNIIPEKSLVDRKRSNFTKSLDLGGVQSIDCGGPQDHEDIDDFSRSVHVLRHHDGKFQIHSNQKPPVDKNTYSKSVKTSLRQYFQWLKGVKSSNDKKKLKTKQKHANCDKTNASCPLVIGGNFETGGQCTCSKFHYHTFQNRTFFLPIEISEKAEKHFASRVEFVEANQRYLNVCNTFWRPALSLNQQRFSNRKIGIGSLVEFESLWPEEFSLKSLLTDGLQNTALRDAISELALLAVVCGPVQLLESLISSSLVRLDCHLEDGQGLLHYACLMRRPQLISYLTKSGVMPELPDRRGYTADETCFCPKIWRHLTNKYHINTSVCPSYETLIVPSFHDKSVLFRMAQMTGNVYEIQMNLQTLNFNVNTECNTDGDFLIHVAVRGGLCQLPLIMTLVRIQHADIELCNSKGMTPLMIAAQSGNSILCDLLICVLGADPNKVNVENGRSALHYAAQNCHEDVVSCLIKRGADINQEDYHGCLPDNLPTMHQYYTSADCNDIICQRRKQRRETLVDIVLNGQITTDDLVGSDLCCVDDEGYTIIMLAARHNRRENLKTLLDFSLKSVDAQYAHTSKNPSMKEIGMTAVSIAASMGHKDSVRLLLLKGANPCIADINGYLPLHHAVIQNHDDIVDVILDFFPLTYKGLKEALDLCNSPALQRKLKVAWQRRQDEIVSPGLLELTMEGNADKLYCLLEEGDMVDTKSAFGSWPLYLAIENGYYDVVTLLCEKGADLRKRHLATGNTVLHLATSLGRIDVLEFLLDFCKPQYGVDVGRLSGSSKRRLSVNALNGSDKTALQLAADKGFLKPVKCLLNHGATTALLDSSGSLFSVPEYEGVWSEILSHRQKHTDLVMNLIEKDSKQKFEKLKKAWVPGFDHNLRDHHGNTPLMAACKVGNVDVVLFLLQSAVYPQSFAEDDSLLEDNSDNDSGVLDTGSVRTDSQEGEAYCTDYLVVRNSSEMRSEVAEHRKVETLLQDISRPSGLFIYHDGFINHVCAVNSMDGSTTLHNCLLKGDNFRIMELLLKIDPNDMTVNLQNSLGLTPLHLACQLERRKCAEILVNCPETDLNIPTLDGKLAEEMTNNKTIIKIVQRGRRGHPVRSKPSSKSRSSSVTNASIYTQPFHSEAQSTINLEKVHSRFEAMKLNLHKHSHQEQTS